MNITKFTPLSTFRNPEKAMILSKPQEVTQLLELLLDEPFGELYKKGYTLNKVPLGKKFIETMIADGTIRRSGLKSFKELQQDLSIGDVICLINEDLKLEYSEVNHDIGDMCWLLSFAYSGYAPNYLDLLKEAK